MDSSKHRATIAEKRQLVTDRTLHADTQEEQLLLRRVTHRLDSLDYVLDRIDDLLDVHSHWKDEDEEEVHASEGDSLEKLDELKGIADEYLESRNAIERIRDMTFQETIKEVDQLLASKPTVSMISTP